MDAQQGKDLLRRAGNPDMPVNALQAIVDLRRYLDKAELDAIRSAREKGATWEDIARALHVSRQAVQQRIHSRLPAERKRGADRG